MATYAEGLHEGFSGRCRQMIEAQRRALGPEHPSTLLGAPLQVVFLLFFCYILNFCKGKQI